jgi:hypothetical protein
MGGRYSDSQMHMTVEGSLLLVWTSGSTRLNVYDITHTPATAAAHDQHRAFHGAGAKSSRSASPNLMARSVTGVGSFLQRVRRSAFGFDAFGYGAVAHPKLLSVATASPRSATRLGQPTGLHLRHCSELPFEPTKVPTPPRSNAATSRDSTLPALAPPLTPSPLRTPLLDSLLISHLSSPHLASISAPLLIVGGGRPWYCRRFQ